MRILIVDDEPGLSTLIAAWVKAVGHEAIDLTDPVVAVSKLSERHFDLLITDIIMSNEMDGVALAVEALKLQPHIKIIFTSGYSKHLNANTRLPGRLITKPYRRADILGAIDAL